MLFSGPKKGPNSGFWLAKFFRPNWSKNGQNMVKSWFLGLKRVQIVVFGQNFFLAKLVKKWPKYGKKLFSRPKKGPNSGFWPKIFWLNWSKNGRNMVNNCFRGLKRVQIVRRKMFWPNWSKNDQNMAKRPIFGKLSLKHWFLMVWSL